MTNHVRVPGERPILREKINAGASAAEFERGSVRAAVRHGKILSV